MKTKLALILGAALLAGSAFAQTNQVLSKNAVGYVKVDLIASNKLHLIRNDFEPLGAPIAISNALASMPNGSQVILWDSQGQAYYPPIGKSQFGGWGASGSNVLPRGSAFYLRTPATATNVATFPLYIMGEVPDEVTAPTTPRSVVIGLQLVGHTYPVETFWTNTALAQSLPIGSQIYTWNVGTQQYAAPIGKSQFGGWGAQGNALIVTPGQGFIVRSTNSFGYAEVKPYTWP